MGTSGWDDDARGRGRSPRDARPREGERASGRSSERGGYASGELRDGRGRSRSRDDGWGDSDRSRAYPGRGERGSDYNRVPGNSGSRNPRPSRDDYSDEYSGRSGRDGRDERPPRESRGGTSGLERGDREERERSGERSVRGQRPPQRSDMYDSQQRRGPSGSGTRSGASGRGGLWDDEPEMRGRRPARAGGSDPRGRSVGAGRPPNPRDPRALRRGLVSEQEAKETEEEKKGVGCGQAILIVFVIFVLGAGLGFAGFKLTTPKVSVDNAAPAAPSVTPSVTPNVSPTATPKADASPAWLARSAPYGI